MKSLATDKSFKLKQEHALPGLKWKAGLFCVVSYLFIDHSFALHRLHFRVSDDSGKLHIQLVSSGDIKKDDLRSEDGILKY